MNASEERFCPSALIPWVFALVALIGCNALVPSPALARKGRDLDGSSLTQVSGESPATGNQSQAEVLLAAGDAGRVRVIAPPPCFLGIDAREVSAVIRGGGGAVQGRAPPVAWLS
jgi:hypothetical protein